jgi:hypothetical protein
MYRPVTPEPGNELADGIGGAEQDIIDNNGNNEAWRTSDADEQNDNRNRNQSSSQSTRKVRDLNTEYNPVILPQTMKRGIGNLNTFFNKINVATGERNINPGNRDEVSMLKIIDQMLYTSTLSSDLREAATHKQAMNCPKRTK